VRGADLGLVPELLAARALRSDFERSALVAGRVTTMIEQGTPHGGAPRDYRAMTRDERAAWVETETRAGRPPLPPREPGAARWLIEPIVRPIIERCSRGAVGWCYSTELGIRVMAFVNTGHVFGEGAVGRWILRQWRQGKLRHRRISPGAHVRGARRATRNGTQLNRYETEAERRERLWTEARERRKQRAAARRRKQEAAAEARRRRRAPATAVLRPSALPERLELMTPEDTRAAIATLLATLDAPPAMPPAPAPPPRERPEPRRDWRELLDEAALEQLLGLEELAGDDDAPE
jgi:hypothetical protein